MPTTDRSGHTGNSRNRRVAEAEIAERSTALEVPLNLLGGGLMCFATLLYQNVTVPGPPIWSLLLVCGVLAGIGLALLMMVMRVLLVRATSFKSELDVVI